MRDFDVSVMGRLYVDHVFAGFDKEPALGTEIYSKSYHRTIGGGAAITSFWLGSMGRSAQVAGVVGHDDTGWFQEKFARAGVSTELLRSSDSHSGITTAITLGGDREFFTNLGANVELEEYVNDDALITKLCSSKHLHITVPLSRAIAKKLISRAHDAGLTVSMDVGYQPGWYSELENRATLHQVDFFFPNEVEAHLLGLTSRRSLRAWLQPRNDGEDCSPAARWVVVKRGSAAAIAASVNSYVLVAPPGVENVDTTGAGEAFNAGFIDGFLYGGDAQAWLRRGCICGALSVGRLGGIGGVIPVDELNKMEIRTYGV